MKGLACWLLNPGQALNEGPGLLASANFLSANRRWRCRKLLAMFFEPKRMHRSDEISGSRVRQNSEQADGF
jgi:hypothetical protein